MIANVGFGLPMSWKDQAAKGGSELTWQAAMRILGDRATVFSVAPDWALKLPIK